MKIAIPTRHNMLCSIMDHCDVLTIVTVEDHRIKSEKYLEIPFYNTINYPERLIKLKIDLFIVGNFNSEFIDLLNKKNIRVITGAPRANPRTLVEFYALLEGDNLNNDEEK